MNINSLMDQLHSDPIGFFEKNQSESSILEYKSSFELDTALEFCPIVKKKIKENLFNQAVSLRLFETLVAFANTTGGLLIMGVAEAGSAIVEPSQREICSRKLKDKINSQKRCYEFNLESFAKIDSLNLIGLNQELSLSGMDFDGFQRHVLDRFSVNDNRKYISFKEVLYPCSPDAEKSNQKRTIHIFMSANLDACIEEIFPVVLPFENEKKCILGCIKVKPSLKPIYLTIDSKHSNNVLYALPVRKTGKTQIEKDVSRIQDYVESHFGSILAGKIVEELLARSQEMASSLVIDITEQNVVKRAGQYAAEWEKAGFPYRMVEKDGQKFKGFTLEKTLWESENRLSVMAFLLMVSLHYNAGWEYWTPSNKKNPLAVTALFETFHMNYWRTRFRALYALQFMDQEIVKNELAKKKHQLISERTQNAIENHVAEKTVITFIREIADANLGDISKKASQVLIEIGSQWKDPEAGMEAPL
jgi:hypothetical protein